MLYSIFCFFSALLLLSGVFFIFYLILSAIASKENEEYFIVVDGYEKNENLPEQIYSAFIQVNMMNFSSKKPVHVIDHDLSDNTKEYLISMTESFCKIVFMKIFDGKLSEE